MATASFTIDESTHETLEGLRRTYGLSTTAETLRRALAVAVVLAGSADEEGCINLVRPDGSVLAVPQRY